MIPLRWVRPLVDEQAAALLERAAHLGLSGQLLLCSGGPPVHLQMLRGRVMEMLSTPAPVPAPARTPILRLLRGGRSAP